jgi:hypothetical protein
VVELRSGYLDDDVDAHGSSPARGLREWFYLKELSSRSF